MTIFVLPFEKMHGTGNDFILLEKRHLPNGINLSKLARLICDRHFSIGADGIIIVDISPNKDADFAWDYFNSDGSEAEMCGNGMRCFARYVYERGFTDETTFSVLTKGGVIKPSLEDDGTVTVDMGMPNTNGGVKNKLTVDGKEFLYSYIETGNPHCVIFTDDEISNKEFYTYGPMIEKHEKFKKGVNVEFAKVINENQILLRVWERGAGPTLACGTGACATLIAANLNGLTDDNANVVLPGGKLKIKWDKATKKVFLNGPAEFVFAGQLNLDPKTVCE